ncbi:uncharacterized protein BHQ10_000076 [Talaromyces amestolkiae]|uniref:Uncharacterized protein n=1 Tax=Talaromyces amestolkiae TaxID=1196081 RepID=A0A364KKJ6_TALAM|nr:uncharacterized protein BHQ10_000076 [Talaromyces amestolkiae]RAO64064.1 hypothetical protein BHQ10_000076 [Talaromyces amestolkiae]
MISFLLLIFLIQLAIYIVNTIGASTIDDLLWILYLRLPVPISKDARKNAELKRDVVQLKREMNATSSQDEFAKWAKLRRKHDKAMEEYEAMTRWLTLNGPRLFIQFYYTKTPVFDLPAGWFPYPVEWILSFPRAPLGSVSIQVWSSACATVISLAGDVVISILQRGQASSRQAQAVPAEKTK